MAAKGVEVEMTEELMKKCQAAKGYLSQPLFGEMFETLEQQYITAWKMSQTTEAREQAWMQLHALYDVYTGFNILAEKGDEWEKAQESKKEAKNRFRVVP